VAAVILIGAFWVRAFYLQIIRHDYYVEAAKSDQLKEYEIPAARGLILAKNGDQTVPIVLNQKLYTIYADPALVKDAERGAETLALALGGRPEDYESKLKKDKTRYVILAKKVDEAKKEQILKKKYPGIAAQETPSRTYPNGQLASQLLGFVNDEAKGAYGVEEALNARLAGEPGQLKAVTDVRGVPLAANSGNILRAPQPGADVVLTVDLAMQKQLENLLKSGLERAKSGSGSALVLDPNSGAVKAMANYPTFDPNEYTKVEDASLFNNNAVSSPLEIGSTMKPLTVAAALELGVVKSDTTYYDPAQWKIDDYTITNVEGGRTPGQRNLSELLNLSINTGATWLLMQMSNPGGTEINRQGRERWHDFMANHYRFGKATGIEQGYEAPGDVPHPVQGYARDLTYANTTFGQGMTATALQLGAAFAAMLNGGTYYQPRLVESVGDEQIKPKVVGTGVVSAKTSEQMRSFMQYVVDNHNIRPKFDQATYQVGGKTGTAQIADPGGRGGYKENDFNGTYVGFVGGDRPEYVIVVVVREPKIGGYAGGAAAQPMFGDIAHMIINNFGVTPRGR
jgi:cell division protein FtsI/penicillin-binding protein 2